jgi:putative ATP-binding cassette transporter
MLTLRAGSPARTLSRKSVRILARLQCRLIRWRRGFAFRKIAGLVLPYFCSEERWIARAFLSAVILIELATVGISVLINRWYARFYDALQNHNWRVFTHELGVFSILAGSAVVLAVYQLFLSQSLQIR